jgi:hypothetical protein
MAEAILGRARAKKMSEKKKPRPKNIVRRFFSVLGPGLHRRKKEIRAW